MADSGQESRQADPIPVEQLTYEQAFCELEEIVTALESEEYSLEEALALFERGQSLARRCGEMLDRAELHVQQIMGEELAPFE